MADPAPAAAGAIPWGFSTGSGRQTDAMINAIRDCGAHVIRTTVTWDSIDPNLDGSCSGANWTYPDHLVSYCNNLTLADGTVGLKLILQVGSGDTHNGEMYNFIDEYAAAVRFIGNRYDGTAGKKLYLLEPGNEPNHQKWMDPITTGVDPSEFGALFAEMMIKIYGGDGNYVGLHDTNPGLLVSTSGMGGEKDRNGINALDFVIDAYESVTFEGHTYVNGFKNHFDVLAYHPYCYPTTPSQDTTKGWRSMIDVRAVMVAQGDGAKKICVTEWGDPTDLDTDVTGAVQNDAQHTAIAARMQDAHDLYMSYSWAFAFCHFRFMNNNKPDYPPYPGATQTGSDNFMGGAIYYTDDPTHIVKKSHMYAKLFELGMGTSAPAKLRPANIRYGVGFTPVYNNATYRGRQFDRAEDKTTGLGVGFVRCDVQWDDIQPTNPGTLGPGLNNTFDWTNVDKVIAECDARGLKWLVMFGYGAPWTNGGEDDKTGPTRDPGNLYPDAARAAHALVDHIQSNTTQVDEDGNPDLLYAFEWWNEPNTEGFYHQANGHTDATGYWTSMRGVFNAIKTGQVGNYTSYIRDNLTPAYPSVRVLTGGATSPQGGTDFAPRDWVKKAFGNGAGQSFDNFNLHIYDWEYGPLWGQNPGDPDYPATWNTFLEAKEVYDFLVTKGRTEQIWVSEAGGSSRPDSTGTDPATRSTFGGFDGSPGHTPGGGQSVTDEKEIDYTKLAYRTLEHAAAWDAYGDWAGPTAWYGIESTSPNLHETDGSAFNYNYGYWQYSATHDGAEKKPATWPAIPSAREIINAIANIEDTEDPTVALLSPQPSDPALHGLVTFYVGALDDVTDAPDLVVKLHRDEHDGHATDVIIGSMAYAGAGGFYNYTLDVDTNGLENATYEFKVTAKDNAGNVATTGYIAFDVDNPDDPATAPVVTLVSIESDSVVDTTPNGMTVEGTITVTATAVDAVDSTVQVQLVIDNIPRGFLTSTGTVNEYSGTFNTTVLSNDTHQLKVSAVNSATLYGYSTEILVTSDNAPVLVLSTPQGGAQVSGFVPMNITAPLGTAVSIWEGEPSTLNVGNAYAIPGGFQFILDTNRFTNGPHVFRAKGVNGGSTGWSDPLTLSINNVPPEPPPAASDPFDNFSSSAPSRTTPSLQQFASRQLRVPFQVGQSGAIAITTSISVIAAQEIRSILATMPGERLMRPEYGSSAYSMIFETVQDDLDGVAEEIRESLKSQVKNSTITAVECTHRDEAPTEIDVTVTFTTAPFQTPETTVVSIASE